MYLHKSDKPAREILIEFFSDDSFWVNLGSETDPELPVFSLHNPILSRKEELEVLTDWELLKMFDRYCMECYK